MARLIWKKAQALATLQAVAQDVADFFNVPAPRVYQPDHYTGPDWQVRFDTLEVWTKAGRAEMNVDISARFAHLYFRFDDPSRAAPFDDCMGRLNRFSGKWNAIGTPGDFEKPQDALDVFRASLRRDFRRVAEPNPLTDDVAAYRAKEAATAARWAAMRAESAQC